MNDIEKQVRHRPNATPYVTVVWNEANGHMLELAAHRGDKGRVRIDARIVPDLIRALNDTCRESGHAYLPELRHE
jgi:hypothetical protein